MLMNAIYLKTQFLYIVHRICGATVSMLASNGVDCGFEHMSVQTKDNGIHIYCFLVRSSFIRLDDNGAHFVLNQPTYLIGFL
jgi:hypothetical protein